MLAPSTFRGSDQVAFRDRRNQGRGGKEQQMMGLVGYRVFLQTQNAISLGSQDAISLRMATCLDIEQYCLSESLIRI